METERYRTLKSLDTLITTADNREESLFDRQAFSRLTWTDQEKFQAYGAGAHQKIVYQSIHHAIERQANLQGEAIAAEYQGQKITYAKLNHQANCLANILYDIGVTRGTNVGLFLERSIWMLTGILGILKTGAAYVPQDARISTKSTLHQIMQSTEIKVVLTLSHLREKIPVQANQIILALDDLAALQDLDKNLASPNMPSMMTSQDDNCFILFTSGTTGKPNGVQVSHGNLCNVLLTSPGDLNIQPGDRVSQLLNIAFDMAAWEILGCLAHGATLMIRGKDFCATAQQCNVIIATPSILERIDVNLCHQTKTVAVAGEPCPKPLANKWVKRCQFINACGPTETTIINTAQHFQNNSRSLNIGKPTPNNTIYILDENRQPCAIGDIGEIWAGGDGVSKGYINNPQLTQERYFPDPFLANGKMMFRTRDLGRWNDDGELEHLGRTDDQVKIKGFRVELDAISTVVESIEGCQHAVTLQLDDKTLITFVRPADVDIEKCKEAISEQLPYYCQPSAIEPREEFPMTGRGKIDKKALLSQILQK